MLGLFGYLAKDLEDKKIMPVKYGRWENLANLDGKTLFLFGWGKEYSVIPFDPFAKDWEFSMGFTNIAASPQLQFRGSWDYETVHSKNLVQLQVINSSKDALFVHKNIVSGESYQRNVKTGVLTSNKPVWFKFQHKDNSIIGSYSLNGTSFTTIGSVSDSVFKSKGYSNSDASFSAADLSADLNVKDLKFIYDGKVVFYRADLSEYYS